MRQARLFVACALVGVMCVVAGSVAEADARRAPAKALVKSHLRAERALIACARDSQTPARWSSTARREARNAARARKVHVRRGSSAGLVRSRARVRTLTKRCVGAATLRPAPPSPDDEVSAPQLPSRRVASDPQPDAPRRERVSDRESADALAGKIERIGRSRIGATYSWGAQGPGIFDCSGFTWWVYAQAGIQFERTSTYRDWRSGIGPDWTRGRSFDQLRPGDMVYLRPSSAGPQHVGLYIGDGKLLHASSGAGRVIISDLTSGYYRDNYIGWLRHDRVGGGVRT